MHTTVVEVERLFFDIFSSQARESSNDVFELLNSGQLVCGVPVLDAALVYPYDSTLEDRLFVGGDWESVAEWHDWMGALNETSKGFTEHPRQVERHVLHHSQIRHQAMFAASGDGHGESTAGRIPDEFVEDFPVLVVYGAWTLLAFIETLPVADSRGGASRGRELALAALGDAQGTVEKVMRFRIESPDRYEEDPTVHPSVLATFQRITEGLAQRSCISFHPVVDDTPPAPLRGATETDSYEVQEWD